MRPNQIRHIFFFLSLFLLSSCVSYQELVNFQQGPPLPLGQEQEIANEIALRIQSDDILHIQVFSSDPTGVTAQPFNLMPLGGNTNMNRDVLQLTGYLVNENGSIDFPVLGNIEVVGLTLQETKDKLTLLLTEYLTDPIVTIRLVNFRITISGEVNRPGTFAVSNERLSILEAIGMAGDLTSYASRDNVLLVREQTGKREYVRLNLHDSAIFTSPYFYLRQNDLIYIYPLEEKVAIVRDRTNDVLPWVAAVTSIVTLVVAIVR